jgi:hypothetical protein
MKESDVLARCDHDEYNLLKLVIPLAQIVIWQALASTIDNPFILPDIGSVLLILLSPGSDIMGSGSLIQNVPYPERMDELDTSQPGISDSSFASSSIGNSHGQIKDCWGCD